MDEKREGTRVAAFRIGSNCWNERNHLMDVLFIVYFPSRNVENGHGQLTHDLPFERDEIQRDEFFHC